MDYRVEAITQPPKHHFFGYYDMKPWDPTGRYHLVLEVDFMDRLPTADDTAVVGVVDLQEGNRFIRLSETRAWNFQQGAMLHWLVGSERTVLFNDRREGRFVCVACEMDSGNERIVGPAIGALSDDGQFAATLNFARLAQTRPGYGYEGLNDPFADQNLPLKDGLGVLNLANGDHRIIISIAELAGRQRSQLRFGRGKAWFNHVLFNPSATRLAFLFRGPKRLLSLSAKQVLGHFIKGYRWPYKTEMWTVGIDGSNPVRVLEGPMIGHFDWKDDQTIIAYASVGGIDAVWQFDAQVQDEPKALFRNTINTDGHICFSPDRQRVATDTYPGPDGIRQLSMVEYATDMEVSLGSYYSPTNRRLGEIRCDLHPSWSGNGRQIAFDGMHEGTRQRYVVTLRS